MPLLHTDSLRQHCSRRWGRCWKRESGWIKGGGIRGMEICSWILSASPFSYWFGLLHIKREAWIQKHSRCYIGGEQVYRMNISSTYNKIHLVYNGSAGIKSVGPSLCCFIINALEPMVCGLCMEWPALPSCYANGHWRHARPGPTAVDRKTTEH